jgi:hypothetical protein
MGIIRERSERLLSTYPGVSRESLIDIYTGPNDTVVKLSKRQTEVTGRTRKHECQTPSKSVKLLLSRLQCGSRYLTWQLESRLDGNDEANSKERFETCLASWVLMDQALRDVYGYEGCIFGPGEICPSEAPTRCQACNGEYQC